MLSRLSYSILLVLTPRFMVSACFSASTIRLPGDEEAVDAVSVAEELLGFAKKRISLCTE
ncbi:hypothetical protein PYJP_06650 [Pyrofollis japonicus]|nr:hypothetical protein PYJP_06650 [Pyrofollis japonicus]